VRKRNSLIGVTWLFANLVSCRCLPAMSMYRRLGGTVVHLVRELVWPLFPNRSVLFFSVSEIFILMIEALEMEHEFGPPPLFTS